MRVLLDEPAQAEERIRRSRLQYRPEVGLSGKKNGVLLSLAEDAGFDVFLTMDKGIQYQTEFGGPAHRDSDYPGQIEALSGFVATRGSTQSDHEFEPAKARSSGVGEPNYMA